ncbi:hypothetical protein [Arthrobacter sp. Y-9]|uniref:hypothetical protein n=1 Tax=Arthrobacter sp. Y-9 TaxID=3039385 RepID=UPI001B2E5FF8|nr:hypothetical protein [Arthrobacter sp. Y-9]MBO9705388.1 hypothetical protein [Arthrobacter sp.]WFR82835.1 hypothetical protein P9849_09645 [Arthrobacter sp. Y-9]
MEHDTTLEHALDIATANSKEAHRLLDQAKAMLESGDVTQERVDQLQELADAADADLVRVRKEQ